MTLKRAHHMLEDMSQLTLNTLQLGTMASTDRQGVQDSARGQEGCFWHLPKSRHTGLFRSQLLLAWTFAFSFVQCK